MSEPTNTVSCRWALALICHCAKFLAHQDSRLESNGSLPSSVFSMYLCFASHSRRRSSTAGYRFEPFSSSNSASVNHNAVCNCSGRGRVLAYSICLSSYGMSIPCRARSCSMRYRHITVRLPRPSVNSEGNVARIIFGVTASS